MALTLKAACQYLAEMQIIINDQNAFVRGVIHDVGSEAG
jgi:hypothetical protein